MEKKGNSSDETEERRSKSSSDGSERDSDNEDSGEEEGESDEEEVDEDDDGQEVGNEDEEEYEDDGDDDNIKQIESEEEFSSKESIYKLLESFSQDQLVGILKEAALKNPELLSRIIGPSDDDRSQRNIFVHGLARDADNKQVMAALSSFGAIESCQVVTDRKTRQCKGYAFVCFKYRTAAMRALKNPVKTIGSNIANFQLASSRNGLTEDAGRRILVSFAGHNLNPERLLTFFSKYGEIEKGTIGQDTVSGKLLDFAFFVYKTVEGCEKALEEPKKFFEGCQLHCRKALYGSHKYTNAQMVSMAGPEAMNLPTQASVASSPLGSEMTCRKILVKNISDKVNPEALSAFFSKFGQIEEETFGHDPVGETMSAIFVYRTVEGCNKALEEPKKFFEGCVMHCRQVIPSKKRSNSQVTSLSSTEAVSSSLQALSQGSSKLMGPRMGSEKTTCLAKDSFRASRIGGNFPSQSQAANRGSGLGLNTISRSVIDSYGTLSAIHGLGAYQNSTSSTILKPESSVDYLGTSRLPTFFGQ